MVGCRTLVRMSLCRCDPPALLHIRPAGVHLPGGGESPLVIVDEVWGVDLPRCSVCALAMTDTFYRCVACDAVVCRRCVAVDTVVMECDCDLVVHVTGVHTAALRAAESLR